MSAFATESNWLCELREAGAQAFSALGLPTAKQEAWRYSNTEPLRHLPLAVPPRPDEIHIANLAVPDIGVRIFCVDGHFFTDAHSELPTGASVLPLAAASTRDHPVVRELLGRVALPRGRALTALNTAMLDDGVLVEIDAGANVDRPLHIVHVSRAHPAQMAVHPRVLLHLGPDARATVIESFVGSAPDTLENAVTEAQLDPRSTLVHLRFRDAAGPHVGATYVAAERDARYVLHDATIGSQLSREEIDVSLRGEGASAFLGGLLLGRGDDRVDHEVTLEHAAPSTTSVQLFNTILDDRAVGTFAGKVIVDKNAPGTDARQNSRALLLAGGARANAKPQLEIYTDDVRCTHGSTSGQLDPDALFYLRARGIDGAEATRMLTLAFAGEWLESIEDESLRESIAGSVRQWLETTGGRTP